MKPGAPRVRRGEETQARITASPTVADLSRGSAS